ncbi:hypothetical protein Ciccas_006269 [Cichlidogyrus casuarinus]|uniref:Uncharacterized protein n=1 Tax=Cichlidogyrus casuarinus TaxID=1844966 RepID=A0ABD2Q7E9_9PLAT
MGYLDEKVGFIGNLYGSVFHIIKKLTRSRNSHIFARKKLAFFVTVCLFLSLYFTLKFIVSYIEIDYIATDKLSICIEDRLKKFSKKLKTNDAVLLEDRGSGQSQIPFIGNGHIGLSFVPSGGIFLRGKEFLSILLSKNLIVNLNLGDYMAQDAHLVDLQEGILHKFRCFKHTDELCISSSSSIFAHRSIPELVVQDLIIHNPKRQKIEIEFSPDIHTPIPGLLFSAESIKVTGDHEYEFQVLLIDPSYVSDHSVNLHDHANTGLDLLKSNLSDRSSFSFRSPSRSESVYLLVVFAKPNLPKSVELASSETHTFHYLYGIKSAPDWIILPSIKTPDISSFSPVLKSALQSQIDAVKSFLLDTMRRSLAMTQEDLYSKHTSAWTSLWRTGFFISPSKADDALNGDRYNLTMYYLLSNVPSQPTAKMPGKSSLCYDGPSTLFSSQLWQPVNTNPTLLALVDLWFVTLRKRGCEPLLGSGEDLIQAMIYSMAALKMSHEHLTMWLKPHDLNRAIHFRRVRVLPSDVYVDFGIRYHQVHSATEVSHDLYARKCKMEESSTKLFVCAANCDPIDSLGDSETSVIIYETNPPSALMHLSTDEKSLVDFKRSQHHNDVQMAEGPRHDLISVHLHGHMLRGLPMFFWITLGFLVVVFHLFICRIVYAELWKGGGPTLPTSSTTPKRHSGSYGHSWDSHSATMASIYVNSHLANRRRQAQHNYRDQLP